MSKRCLRDDDSNTVVATVSPAVIGAPRPVTGRRREAGILAPGSSLPARLPEASSPQWIRGPSLAGYSCGGSRGITPRSDLNPLREPFAWGGSYPRKSADASIFQQLGVMAQMIGHESLNEIIAVIVTRLHSQPQRLT